MKNLIILLSCFVLAFSSCTHDDSKTVTPISSSSSAATPGSGWSLTLLSERSDNKTSHYSGYTFEFAADGTMSAVRSGTTVTGTWRQYQDDGITKFAISLITTDSRLLELNDDWALVSKSDNLISLKDDNSTSNEQLQFSK
ncbi:MAG: hypothetical protein K0Q79_2651 [Flavipsychrobacter sp.]|jgi:hypothetical protein|nr:hypothetical protein [Flavipsychrobacter sp.]